MKRTLTLAGLLILMLSVRSAIAEIIPHGHWPLSGDAKNTVAGGADGEITNEDTGGLGAGGSVWVESTIPGLGSRTVISFDGGTPTETAYVRAGDIPHMTLENDFTWSFWSNTSPDISGNSGQFAGIVGNRYEPGPGSVDFVPRQFIKFTPTAFEVHMDGAGADNIDFGDDDLVPGEWVHQAVVKEGPGFTYYRGGIQLLTGAYTAPLDGPMPFWFGGDDAGNPTEQWHGLLAEVKTFTSALTDAEVLAMVPEPANLLFVGGSTAIGSLPLSGPTTDAEFGDPVVTQGLSQYWFDGNMRGNVEAFLEAGDTGSADFPLVNPGGKPVVSEDTWWRGSAANVLTDVELERYPAGLTGTRFEGSNNEDNYGVRLTGEIFFAENGEYLIRDGIDDFTMIAIDADGNGELDSLADLVSADVGSIGGVSIDDVHVLDDDWAALDGGSQDAAFHGVADIENVPADGEWRSIEIWMSEGGGGDGGIVYMGKLDDPDIFDDTLGDALSQEERDAFVIAPERLRTQIPELLSGNSAATLRTDVEYVMQVGPDGADQILLDDSDGVLTTTLDISDATIRVEAIEGLVEGTTVTLFDADAVTGIASAAFLFDDASLWDLSSLASGQITFGVGSACNPGTQGDVDGNGTVEFADFLILSANFGTAVASHEQGDIDCNGTVEFADFLVLSANFGATVGAAGEASGVPEPSGLALLSIVALLGGALRRLVIPPPRFERGFSN